MRKLFIVLLFTAFFLNLSACAWMHPYQPDVQQGNIITPDMIALLKPGMSKAEVSSILGTPLLEDAFNDDVWSYVYTFQHRGGKIMQKHFNLYFKNDRLVHMSGDYGSSF